MPQSLWLFVFTAVVYGLQNVPGPDGVLMVLLASMWPLVTINAGFTFMAVEAVTGRVSMGWLLPVGLYFGSNLVIAGLSHLHLSQFEKAVEQFNATRAIPFSPETESLLIKTQASFAPVPWSLLENYDIPVVFSQNLSTREKQTTALRVGVDPLCKQLWRDQAAGKGNRRVFGYLDHSRKRSPLVQNMCTYRQPQSPHGKMVTVTANPPVVDDRFLLVTNKQTITLTSTTGVTTNLLYAHAIPIHWFPLPFGGCFRGPGDAKSRCEFGPLRVFSVPAMGGTHSATDLLAKALGLKASIATERRDKIMSTQAAN